MAVFKCNHDVQFVSISGSKDAASYVSKYCFKSQNPVENAVALSLAAFTKAVRKTNQLPADTSAMERGFRILGSMLYTVTNGQEVASPMAALYILRESPFWFSHEFVRVNLRSLLQQQQSAEVRFSQDTCTTQSNFSTDTALERYWKRQSDLESVPFIDVCEHYVQVKSQKRRTQQALSFKPVNYSKLEATKVLVICGDDIPDISGRLEQLELDFYYKGMLTLFKPHRRSTLLNTAWSPLVNYREFVQRGDTDLVCRLQQYETQWKDYYRAKQTGDNGGESEEDVLLRTRPPPTNEWSPAYDTNDDTQNNASRYACDIPDDFLDTTTITAPDASTTTLAHNSSAIVETIPMLGNAIKAVSGIYKSKDSLSPPPGFDYNDYQFLVVSAEVSANDEGRMGTDNFIAQFKEAPTRLERLQECFGPVSYRELDGLPRYSADTLPSFPSIELVPEAFQLNFWQHVVFESAARHLLYAYSQDIADALSEPILPLVANASPYELKPQLIAYLGGEAGTGKSTVVDALLRFASRWGREGSVETLAFTGAAAINIKGRTMHSARNLKINGAEPNAAPTTEMKSKFSRVILIAIDIISITDQALLGGTDSVSRALSKKPEAFMGGRHTLLIGDQHQLPPIAGSPCFKTPPATANRLRHAGYELYSDINFVVFLSKNMRARFDPEYTQILADLRWGRVSDEQLASLNTSVQTGDQLQASISEPYHDEFYRPVIVCTNKLRCAINLDFTFRVAKARGLPIYECLAVPTSRSRKIADHLANVNDDLTDRVPMKLLLFVGMPVMLTRKHPLLLDADVIANGVLGTIVGMYPAPEELPLIRYEVDGVVVHKLLSLPKLLLVKLHGYHNTLVNGFPEGVIGLPPLHASLRLSKIPNLSQASITVDQFAAVPAFACTTEKLQGQTCHDGVVVTPLDRRRGVPTQTLYVALSRAVSLAGLTLTESITREYLARFRPTKETADEIHRLMQLVRLPRYAPTTEIEAFNQWKASQALTP